MLRERKLVIEYLVARWADVESLRNWYFSNGLPDESRLPQANNVADQAMAIVRHCERIGLVGLEGLTEAIQQTPGQDSARSRALDALAKMHAMRSHVAPSAIKLRIVRHWRPLSIGLVLAALAIAEWTALGRADTMRKALSIALPRYQGSQTFEANQVQDYIVAVTELEQAYGVAGEGQLALSEEHLQRASDRCDGECSLAAVIDLSWELLGIATGRVKLAERALKQLEQSTASNKQEAYALGALAWQLAVPRWKDPADTTAPARPWFTPADQKRLLVPLDTATARRLEEVAAAAKAIVDLRLEGSARVLGDAQTDTDVRPPRFEADAIPAHVLATLKRLHSEGWPDAELLLACAYATVAPQASAKLALEGRAARIGARPGSPAATTCRSRTCGAVGSTPGSSGGRLPVPQQP